MLVNLNDVLKKAQAEKYAVGLFNAIDCDMAQAAIEAAEEQNSPIIIGTAQILLPYGELKLLLPSFRALAERANVPVVLHFDHGLTYERCIEALQLGCTSVMFDGSSGNMQKNMEDTALIVRIAHAMGASVEGEIGHVGQAAVGDEDLLDMYTKPEDAVRFVQATGVDALAVAIGTAHGNYQTKPVLDIERLRQIRGAVNTPLVLHGGSGLSAEDFRNTIEAGIAKINIFTELCETGVMALKQSLGENQNYLEIRNAKVEAIKHVVAQKMQLFGSVGKA